MRRVVLLRVDPVGCCSMDSPWPVVAGAVPSRVTPPLAEGGIGLAVLVCSDKLGEARWRSSETRAVSSFRPDPAFGRWRRLGIVTFRREFEASSGIVRRNLSFATAFARKLFGLIGGQRLGKIIA